MTGVARGKIIRVVVTWWEIVGMIGREPWPDDIGERWRRFDVHRVNLWWQWPRPALG